LNLVEARRMTFKHKLSARLALMKVIVRRSLAMGAPFLAAILPLLPVKLDSDHLLYSACAWLFIKLWQIASRTWRAASRDILWIACGNRRKGRHEDNGTRERRSDLFPCWELFVWRPWVLRIAFPQVPKIVP
jgi:hypothetical protein